MTTNLQILTHYSFSTKKKIADIFNHTKYLCIKKSTKENAQEIFPTYSTQKHISFTYLRMFQKKKNS